GFVQSYQAQYQGTGDSDTYAATRTSGYDGLNTALRNFTNDATSATGADLTALRNARNGAVAYYFNIFRDLGSFMQLVKNNTSASTALRNAAQGVLDSLSNLVFSKTSDHRNSSGVAIYLPAVGSSIGYDYGSQFAAFNAATGWGTFLNHLISNAAR